MKELKIGAVWPIFLMKHHIMNANLKHVVPNRFLVVARMGENVDLLIYVTYSPSPPPKRNNFPPITRAMKFLTVGYK